VNSDVIILRTKTFHKKLQKIIEYFYISFLPVADQQVGCVSSFL